MAISGVSSLRPDVEYQPAVLDRQMQDIGTLGLFPVPPEHRKMIGGGEVGDRLLPVGLDEWRQRAPWLVVQDDAVDGHIGGVIRVSRTSACSGSASVRPCLP